MSLYQEVRPTNLDQIIGNDSTVGALKQILRKPNNERPHAIMIKGPSGCGKTTIARILAKEFRSSDQDTMEYNAANTRGVDTIREIQIQAGLVGFGGGSKTYIFDESHQLTGAAQEALLKLIEDGPSHCYFVFCTTEPEKIIKTVRNRCAEYSVEILNQAEIKKLLNIVCKQKSIKVEQSVIEAIVYTCDGSPRSAVISLEQVMDLSVDDALEILVRGTDRDSNVIELCKLLIQTPELRRKKWKQTINTYSRIQEDSEIVRKSILTFLFNKLDKHIEKEEDAEDVTKLLDIFSVSTHYGGRSLLGAMIAKACFSMKG